MKRFALAYVCVLVIVGQALGQSGSALADLIQAGNRKAALDRIRTGADVNEAQPDGTRPIHWAVYKVDYELIEALKAKKATVDVANEFGSTPLAEAVKLADERMVRLLLDAGARVDDLIALQEDGVMVGRSARIELQAGEPGRSLEVIDHTHPGNFHVAE